MSAKLPNATDTIIATGYNCQVRIGENTTGHDKIIGMATSFQASEDFQVQEAICLGNLGPISLDPQGYNCSITIDGFLPSNGPMEGSSMEVGDTESTAAMLDYVPQRKDFMNPSGEGKMPQKMGYLDFFDKRANNGQGRILCKFTGVIVTNNGVNAEGNSYVRNNVQLRALEWDKD